MFASTGFLQRLGALGFLAVVGTSAPTDTTRQQHGYAGVLPVPPAVIDGGDEVVAQSPDILGQRRGAVRTEKGRVLYAKERVSAPADEAVRSATTAHGKRTCSQLTQSRLSSTTPTS